MDASSQHTNGGGSIGVSVLYTVLHKNLVRDSTNPVYHYVLYIVDTYRTDVHLTCFVPLFAKLKKYSYARTSSSVLIQYCTEGVHANDTPN